VSRARAFGVSQSWGKVPYYETTARRKEGVNEAFVDLCRQIIRKDIATAHVKEMERGNRPHRPHRKKKKKKRPAQDGPRCNIL